MQKVSFENIQKLFNNVILSKRVVLGETKKKGRDKRFPLDFISHHLIYLYKKMNNL